MVYYYCWFDDIVIVCRFWQCKILLLLLVMCCISDSSPNKWKYENICSIVFIVIRHVVVIVNLWFSFSYKCNDSQQ